MSYHGGSPPNPGYGPGSNLHMPYPSSMQYGQSPQQQQGHHPPHQQPLHQPSHLQQLPQQPMMQPISRAPTQNYTYGSLPQMQYPSNDAFYQSQPQQPSTYMSQVDYSMPNSMPNSISGPSALSNSMPNPMSNSMQSSMPNSIPNSRSNSIPNSVPNGYYQQPSYANSQAAPSPSFPSYLRQEHFSQPPSMQQMNYSPSPMQQHHPLPQQHSPMSAAQSPLSHHPSPMQPQSGITHHPSPLMSHRSSMSHHPSPLQPEHSPLPHQPSPLHPQTHSSLSQPSPRMAQHPGLHQPSPLQPAHPGLPHQPSPLQNAHPSLPPQLSPRNPHPSPLPQFQHPPTPQHYVKPSPTMSVRSFDGKPPLKRSKKASKSGTPVTPTTPIAAPALPPVQLVAKPPARLPEAPRPVEPVRLVKQEMEPLPPIKPEEPEKMYQTINPSDIFKQETTIKPSDIFKPQDTIKPSDIFKPQETVKLSDIVRPMDTIKPTDLVRPSDTVRPSDLFKAPELVKPSDIFKPLPLKPLDTVQPSDLVKPVNIAKSFDGDQHLLLLVLAEEYFSAAHKIGPAVAISMQPDVVEKYHKLMATGLGCLEAALKNTRLTPRMEAAARLRYAGILCDETENIMEAETALAKGIVICDRHRFHDLKYSMTFLLAQLNFRKSPKAAFKALEGHIADAEAYQHIPWVYAFRFLRASMSVESRGLSDMHAAVQNLRQIGHVANTRGDKAIALTASLMETLVHLGSGSHDAIEQAQRALASALGHQFDAASKIPQLTCLTHMLDLVCSFLRGEHHLTVGKVKKLQQLMDQFLSEKTWGKSNVVSIPITRTKGQSQVVSENSHGILSLDPQGQEMLNISFINRNDAYALTHLLSGVIYLHKDPNSDGNVLTCLRGGLNALSSDVAKSRSSSDFLPPAQQKLEWRGLLMCYFHIYLAFCSAAMSQWKSLKNHLREIEKTADTFGIPLSGPVGYFQTYLTGIYHQGCGDFDQALNYFRDSKFELSDTYSPGVDFTDQFYRDLSILAALNSLCIAQDHSMLDYDYNTTMVAHLEPLCTKHSIKEISTAFNLIKAIITTNPPAPMYEIKNCLKTALAQARAAQNNLFSCVALSVMYTAFFKNVVGDQAEKSAKAAVAQARMSGNPLWMSVADGLLSQCLEIQGKKSESQAVLKQALKSAQQAVPGF